MVCIGTKAASKPLKLSKDRRRQTNIHSFTCRSVSVPGWATSTNTSLRRFRARVYFPTPATNLLHTWVRIYVIPTFPPKFSPVIPTNSFYDAPLHQQPKPPNPSRLTPSSRRRSISGNELMTKRNIYPPVPRQRYDYLRPPFREHWKAKNKKNMSRRSLNMLLAKSPWQGRINLGSPTTQVDIQESRGDDFPAVFRLIVAGAAGGRN